MSVRVLAFTKTGIKIMRSVVIPTLVIFRASCVSILTAECLF